MLEPIWDTINGIKRYEFECLVAARRRRTKETIKCPECDTAVAKEDFDEKERLCIICLSYE